VSLFQQTGKPRREALFFHFPNYAWHMDNRLGGAVRAGNHKLIRNYDDGSVELYNLKSDLGETKNLAKRQPEIAARLNRKLGQWLADTGAWMPKPPKPKGI
jgi:arylsulfatase A